MCCVLTLNTSFDLHIDKVAINYKGHENVNNLTTVVKAVKSGFTSNMLHIAVLNETMEDVGVCM